MANKNTRIIFFGTPEFASGILKSLIEADYDIPAVFAQPDKKIGRRQELLFSPVKKLALANNIKIFQPKSLQDSGLIEDIKKIGADLFIVAAYGKILPKEILEIPKRSAINVHASLLPKYRGASPVQSAIAAGEKETGITLMLMSEKMDEGDILAQKKITITQDETASKLLARLSNLGIDMIKKLIPEWADGKINPISQDCKKATYCRPIRREDGKISWSGDTAAKIYNKWRAYHSWPGIFSTIKLKNIPKKLKFAEIKIVSGEKTGEKAGKIVKYKQEIAVQAKGGLVVLKKIQLEGKKEMDTTEFLRGYPEIVGNELC